MTTLADIAAALREHSPGVLPEDLSKCGTEFWVKLERDILMPLPEPIAAAVLIAVMVAALVGIRLAVGEQRIGRRAANTAPIGLAAS